MAAGFDQSGIPGAGGWGMRPGGAGGAGRAGAAGSPPGLRRPGGSGKGLALVAFVTPALVWMEFSAVGRIFVPELILIGLLPFLLMTRGRMLAEPLPRTFLMLAALWLASQVLSDLVRETEFRDYSRGWARIAFTAANFCSLYMLLHGSRRRLVLFALGLAVGGYLSFRLNPSVYAEDHPWKFGIGPPAALLAVLASLWPPIRRVPFLPALPLLAVSAYSTAVGFRSLAGVALLASLYMLVQQIAGRRHRRPAALSPGRTLLFLAAGVALTAAVLKGYEQAAARGYVSERARWTYEQQDSGSFGVLLGGRSAIYVSARAVMDSPFLGHGSWARDAGYAARVLELRLLGYDLHPLNMSRSDLIPTHSHLMGGWVEAGFLGAVFWLWVLLLVFRVLSDLYLIREPLGPLIAFIGFMTLWDVVFSPFGAERRLTLPFNVVLMMFAWDVLRARLPREGEDGPGLLPRLRRTRALAPGAWRPPPAAGAPPASGAASGTRVAPSSSRDAPAPGRDAPR